MEIILEKKVEEASSKKERVKVINETLVDIEKEEEELSTKLKQLMMTIPQIIDDSVPIGKDDTENVEIEKFGEPVVPSYEIPYHADILESISGLDKESSGRTSGNGFSQINKTGKSWTLKFEVTYADKAVDQKPATVTYKVTVK